MNKEKRRPWTWLEWGFAIAFVLMALFFLMGGRMFGWADLWRILRHLR